MKPAVFLDRDGTIIEQVPYLNDPGDVRLIGGAPQAIRMLRSAGYACLLITNQSAIGRGLLPLNGFHEIQNELHRQLNECGTQLDGTYFCTVVPRTAHRQRIEHVDRKPGPGLLHRAAREMGLDLSRSWMVGDMVSDVYAGRNAGCRGSILVRTGNGAAAAEAINESIAYFAADILEAAKMIIHRDGLVAPTSQPSEPAVREKKRS